MLRWLNHPWLAAAQSATFLIATAIFVAGLLSDIGLLTVLGVVLFALCIGLLAATRRQERRGERDEAMRMTPVTVARQGDDVPILGFQSTGRRARLLKAEADGAPLDAIRFLDPVDGASSAVCWLTLV